MALRGDMHEESILLSEIDTSRLERKLVKFRRNVQVRPMCHFQMLQELSFSLYVLDASTDCRHLFEGQSWDTERESVRGLSTCGLGLGIPAESVSKRIRQL